MTPERWGRIKEVFGTALELPPEERPAYLAQACGADPALLRQVEQLLEAESGALENPLLDAVARSIRPDLARGEMLGPYRVETKIGQGGMGVVYRAWDTRLDRRVALKILRPEQIQDPAWRQRLFREARAASGLIHPNIVTVHDVGSDRDIDFIAMEHVEGRPLDEVIPAAGLSPRQAIAYAIQISGALAGAHAAGLVHRDLKPGNIMVTREGLVKLLDFGLARKSAAHEGSTVTLHTNFAGTPQYMSPEQIRGEPLDHRTDIFAFGVVLYRMLAGRELFARPTAVETMNGILNDDAADLVEAGPPIPEAFARVILHCVEKAPDERFQSARDVGYALEAATAPIGPAQPPVGGGSRRYAVWAAAFLAAVAAGWLGGRFLFPARPSFSSVDGRFFAQLTNDAGAELFPALSPDGKTLAFASKRSGNWDIYLQPVGSSEAIDLTRDSPSDDTQPAFSRDGRWIAFRSERGGGGLFVMRPDGSGVRRVSDAGFNPAWSSDSRELVYGEESITRPEDRSGRLSHLWAVEVKTGRKRLLTKEDGVQPDWSPNGRYVVYWAIDLDGDRDLWTVPSSGGPPVRITRDAFLDWNPVWSPDGLWLYFCSNRGGAMGIWRVPMKEGSGEARGAPEAIHTPANYPAYLSFSRDGRELSFAQQITTGRLETVRYDPQREAVVSEPKELIESTKGASRPALSPDGEWLAFNSTEQQEDLFVIGADGSGLRQVTHGGYRNRGPRWSPDGKHIAYFSTRSGDWEIWSTDPAGMEAHQITYAGGNNLAWPVWSADSRRVAYTIFGLSSFLIEVDRPWASQTPERLPPYPGEGLLFNVWDWSPDGKRLAGFLNRDDGVAVYSLASHSYQKVTPHGADPVWLSDNRRLLFLDRGEIFQVDSATGQVKELLSVAPEEIARRGFAVSRDDHHIYFSVASTEADVWMIGFDR